MVLRQKELSIILLGPWAANPECSYLVASTTAQQSVRMQLAISRKEIISCNIEACALPEIAAAFQSTYSFGLDTDWTKALIHDD